MIFDVIGSIKESMSAEPMSLSLDEASVKKIISSYNQMGLSADAFAEKTGLCDKALLSYFNTAEAGSATLKGCKVHIEDVNNSIGLMGVKAKATTIIMTGLKAALNGIITGAIIALVSKFVQSLIDTIPTAKKIREEAEKAKENISDITNHLKEQQDTIENVKQRYAELAQGVNQISGENLTLSNDKYQEFLDISNQLAELFPSLTENYDSNGNAILNLKGNVNDIVTSLDNLLKKEQEFSRKETLDNLPQVYDDYIQKIDEYNNKLEDAKKRQESYSKLKERFLNPTYETADKKNVTFSFVGLDDQTKQETINYLLKNVDGVRNYLVRDIELLGQYTTQVTLSLDKAFKGFDNRLFSAHEDIVKYNNLIKKETASFNYYLNMLLQEYQDADILPILQQLLSDTSWIELAREELGNKASFDDIVTWVEEEYIYALEKLNNDKYKNKLTKLFTDPLLPQEKVDLAKEIQQYFEENDIKISLGFIWDEKDDNSTQNLLARFNRSLTDRGQRSLPQIEELKEFTKDFTEEQMLIWLDVTEGIYGATKAIEAYNEYFNQPKEEYTSFFTEDNKEQVDKYISKINDLISYYNKLNTVEGLTKKDEIELNEVYEIVCDSSEDYKQRILDEITALEQNDEIIKILRESIKSCTDAQEKLRLINLLDSLLGIDNEAINAEKGIDNIVNFLNKVNNSAKLISSVKESIKNTGAITSDILSDIMSTYPELIGKVAEYNTGIISSGKLLNELNKYYQIDLDNYKLFIGDKILATNQFKLNILDKLPDIEKKLCQSYQVDFTNYKKLIEKKQELENTLAKNRIILAAKAEIAEQKIRDIYYDPNKVGLDADGRTTLKTLADSVSENGLNKQNKELEQVIESCEKAINFVDLEMSDFNLTFSDSNEKNGNEFKESINWINHSLDILNNQIEKCRYNLDMLSDSGDFKNQKKYIQELINALTKLEKKQREAGDKYSKGYSKDGKNYKKLLKLISSKEAEEYYNKITSGEEFSIEEFIDKTTSSNDKSKKEQIYDLVKTMMEAFNDSVDAYNAADSTLKEIQETEYKKYDLEVSKYQQQLDVVTAKLSSQNLTVKEKNALLREQYRLQTAINEELRKKAEEQGNQEVVNKLDVEDENNKLNSTLEQLESKSNRQNTIKNSYDSMGASKDLKFEDKEYYIRKSREQEDKNIDYQLEAELAKLNKKELYGFLDEIATKEEEAKKEEFKNDDRYYNYLSNRHKQAIANKFIDSNYSSIYYSHQNDIEEQDDEDYDSRKANRSNKLDLKQSKIQVIQNKIDLSGSRGTVSDYSDMITEYKDISNLYQKQLEDAEKMLEFQEKGTENWYKYKKEIDEANNALSETNIKIKEINQSILSIPLNYIEDKLREIKSSIDKINYSHSDNEEIVQAAISFYDQEIRLQEKNKKVLTDKINELQHEQEVKQRILNISKAEWELQKAKNQKTNKVFHEGVGFVYETDEDSIRAAQEQYDNAMYDKRIGDLNDRVWHIDEIIGALQIAQNAWKEMTEEAQLYANVQNVINKHGMETFLNLLNNVNSERDKLAEALKTDFLDLAGLNSEQKKYEYVSSCIEEIIETYNLEKLTVEDATIQILSILQSTAPDIYELYKTEQSKIKELITTKQQEVKEQKDSNDKKLSDIKSTNKEVLAEYDIFKDSLSEKLSDITNILSEFSTNIEKISGNVIGSISNMMSAINSVTGMDITINNSNSNTKGNKKGEIINADVRHSGITTGYVGDTAKNKREFRAICLDELKPYEELNVLKKGECVLTPAQQQNILDNCRSNIFIQPNSIGKTLAQNSTSLAFTGDIILNNVQDINTLANDITRQLPQAMLQKLYNK